MSNKRAAIVGLLVLLGCASLPWRSGMKELTLELSVARKEYSIGEEVLVAVTMRNHSSQIIVVPKIGENGTPSPIFTIERPDGSTSVFDPLKDRPEIRSQKELARYLLTGIEPGQALSVEMLPGEVGDFDQPGKYHISARFRWDRFDLASEQVGFRMAGSHISNMVLRELSRDPEAPPIAQPDSPETWGGNGLSAIFQISDDSGRNKLGDGRTFWHSQGMLGWHGGEWPIEFGDHIWVSGRPTPAALQLVPIQTVSALPSFSATMARAGWTRQELWYGEPTGKDLDGYDWHRVPSPLPIASGLRYLHYIFRPAGEADIFVLFEGEDTPLGHTHITSSRDHEEHTPLRTIAQLGPDLVAAQVMRGPAEAGAPIVLTAVRHVPTGAKVVFLGIDGQGRILTQAQRPLPGLVPLGPVAMTIRIRGAVVEVAFPAIDKYTNTLRVVRLATTTDLQSSRPPVVSEPIKLDGAIQSMVIDYSHFPAFFPNGVGLLIRQSGGRASFWTERRGLKPLPFPLRDRDEVLILGRRSSWYVLVNDGARLHAEAIDSVFKDRLEQEEEPENE
jgi:hypothetical protein